MFKRGLNFYSFVDISIWMVFALFWSLHLFIFCQLFLHCCQLLQFANVKCLNFGLNLGMKMKTHLKEGDNDDKGCSNVSPAPAQSCPNSEASHVQNINCEIENRWNNMKRLLKIILTWEHGAGPDDDKHQGEDDCGHQGGDLSCPDHRNITDVNNIRLLGCLIIEPLAIFIDGFKKQMIEHILIL